MEDRLMMADTNNNNEPTTIMPRGALMAPHELGEVTRSNSNETSSEQTKKDAKAHADNTKLRQPHPGAVLARQRTLAAIARMQQNEQALSDQEYLRQQAEWDVEDARKLAAEEEGVAAADSAVEEDVTSSSPSPQGFVTSFTYQGMSVIIGTTAQPSVYVVCARTQLVLQELDVVSTLAAAAADGSGGNLSPIAGMASHPTSGQLVIVHANGLLRTFAPSPVDPTEKCFGRYEWLPTHAVLDAGQLFSGHSSNEPTARKCEVKWHVGVSMNDKILLAHGNQLAVLDTSPELLTADPASTPTALPAVNVVWMSRMPGVIRARVR
jgi:hypothetical protein